jgi:hypothetical protein
VSHVTQAGTDAGGVAGPVEAVDVEIDMHVPDDNVLA